LHCSFAYIAVRFGHFATFMTFDALGTSTPTLTISTVEIRVMGGSATGATNGGVQSAREKTNLPSRYSFARDLASVTLSRRG
jgi:hypothetical protein